MSHFNLWNISNWRVKYKNCYKNFKSTSFELFYKFELHLSFLELFYKIELNINLPVPLRINRNVRYVSVKHGPQFRVDITYLVDSFAYHLHLSFLRCIYFVERLIEESTKPLAVV